MSETPSTNYSMIQPHMSESEESLSARPFNVTEPVVAKRICFYKSGDPQFNGVKMVVNSRSFKSFDALLDNLSKRVPLPFGVRNITTPRGIHSVTNLEDLEDGKSYICSQQRRIKPINLETASKKPLPWQISRPISARRRAIQLAREGEGGVFQRGGTVRISTPKKLLVFKNGDVRIRRTIVLGKKNTQNFEALLDHISELMQYPVVKLYATDGRKVPSLQALILCSGAVVAAGREPFKAGNYDPHRYSLPGKLPGVFNRVYPRTNAEKSEGRKTSVQVDSSSRSQIFSASASSKGYSNDNNSDFSYVPENDMGVTENHSHVGEDLFVVPPEDDVEKSVHLNQDGSMTVEMRVRFKIKEEETIKWTTTVSRAGLSGDTNANIGTSATVEEDESSELNALTCTNNGEDFNGAEGDVALQQICTEVTDQNSASGIESSNYDIWQSPMNIDLSQADNDNVKPCFYRPPTPGPRRVRKKKALVQSVTVVSDTAVKKKMVGQFSYSEEMDNGETKSEYCVVTHASSKTTSVTSPKCSEICSNNALKQSLEDQTEEEMLSRVDNKARMDGNSLELSSGDGLFQNVFEKSVVKEGLHDSLTSSSHISHAESSPRKCHLGQVLANQSAATASSFNSHSEWSQSKSEEIICNHCKVLHSSQAFIHPPPAESNNTALQCAQMTPTVSNSSFITAKNGRAECVTPTHLSDASQAASSKSKKKKKKKKRKSSSDNNEQDLSSQQNLHEISVEGTVENEIKTCEMHTTRDSTQHSSTQITIHKEVLEFPVGKSDGSNKNVGTKEDVSRQVSMTPQQKFGPNLKQNLNRQLPKIKSKPDKKLNLLPSAKLEEGQLLIEGSSKNEIERMKKDACDPTSLTVETSAHLASLKSLTETESGNKAEAEKGKKSHKSSTKQKKTKKNKKMESARITKVNVSDETKTLNDFSHADFTNELTEHYLENYVQSWLQNVFPNAETRAKRLAPLHSNDRKMNQLSVKSFSDKERLGKNVHLTGNNKISEGKLSNRTLNHFAEIEAVEASVKELSERHSCLTDAEESFIEEAKYLLQSDMQNNTKLSMCNIIHENDRNKIQSEIDNPNLSDYQKCSSEVATQVDPKAITNIFGTDAQMDCVSSLLLHQLKSARLKVENNPTECTEKSSCLTDISSPALIGSSKLLLAWLLLLNLKESLSSMCKDDMVQTTCNSEIYLLLQYLKQVAVKEEAEDLKAAVSNLQKCTGNNLVFSVMPIEKQELAYCQENASRVEIKNTPDFEEQEKPNKIPNNSLNSKEITDANKLPDALESSSEEQNCSMPTEKSNLIDLNSHSALQNPSCAHDKSNNCGLDSVEELPKENEDLSLQESQERNTDTSFNNEESGISEEPNSTIHSVTSNDKDHTFDLETSELDDKELKSTEKERCAESLWGKENSSGHFTSASEIATNCDREENSVQEDLEEDGTCEETSGQLSPSPLSFCYESKQIPVDTCEKEPISRVKLIVKELEYGSYSNSSELKKCLKSPVTSDLSDYRPETDDSDYNCRSSSDLTNESAEEARYEREYNTGYVKRTIERLYGKAEASLWPTSKPGPPYMAQLLQKDAEESFHTVMEEAPSLCQAYNIWSNEKVSSLAPHAIPEDISSNAEGNEKSTLPAPQFSLNGEEAYYIDEYTNQHCQPRTNIDEVGGVLIDKGKWLLKENHLIRRSPPENSGMYGNIDTTSADTVFDNHSDDIPYSHFGNLDPQPPLKEISSSELEDMVKPCDNQCNYFNMPHNSDSEPFPDALSLKSKNSQYGSSLHFEATRKICTTSTPQSTEVNSNFPAFASVEFRLPDNKVHPEQPSHDEPVQSQPTSNANSNRNNLEDQDSLDKLHAICGQHCPILTAIIQPTNEEIRGCVYRKASDIENQVGLHLLMNTPHLLWQGKNVIRLDKSHAGLKKSCCINKIANNIFNRLYADNTLDFMYGDNSRLLMSAALKEYQGLKKLHAREDMDVNAREINNHDNNTTKGAVNEIAAGQNNNLSVFQSSRGNVNQIVGERNSASFTEITEGCRSEDFYHHGTSLNNIDWKVTVINLEDNNALGIKEETLSYVIEDKSGNDHLDS